MSNSNLPSLPINQAARSQLQKAADDLNGAADANAISTRLDIESLLGDIQKAEGVISQAFAVAKDKEGVSNAAALKMISSQPAVKDAYAALEKFDDEGFSLLLAAREHQREIRKAEHTRLGIGKAESRAEEIRKADSSISRADALRQAMRDPVIAAAYRAQQAAA